MQTKRGMVLNILMLATVLFMIFALASDTTPVGQVGNLVNLRSELPANVARFAPKDADAIPFKANIKIKSIPADFVVHWNTFKYKKSTFLLSYRITVQKASSGVQFIQPVNGNSVNMGTIESVIQRIDIALRWENSNIIRSRIGTISISIQSDGIYKFY